MVSEAALGLDFLVHAVGTLGGNLVDLEALVGADALVVEEVLVLALADAQVDVALLGEGGDGTADCVAGLGDVVHVELQGVVVIAQEAGGGGGGKGQGRQSGKLHDAGVVM